MFDHMFEDEENKLKEKFERYGLTDDDREFIKEQISGKPKGPEDSEVVLLYFQSFLC